MTDPRFEPELKKLGSLFASSIAGEQPRIVEIDNPMFGGSTGIFKTVPGQAYDYAGALHNQGKQIDRSQVTGQYDDMQRAANRPDMIMPESGIRISSDGYTPPPPLSPDQQAARGQRGREYVNTLLFSAAPVIGQGMALNQVYNHGREAVSDAQKGHMGSLAANVGGMALAATGALPGATFSVPKNSLGVFFAVPPKERGAALDMQASGATNKQIFEKTGQFFGRDGIPRHEVDLSNAIWNPKAFDPGEKKLADMLEHDELFALRPDLRDKPFVMEPVSREVWRPRVRDGKDVIPLDPNFTKDPKNTIYGLLQYQAQGDGGLNRPMGYSRAVDQLTDTINATKKLDLSKPENASYLAHLMDFANSYASKRENPISATRSPARIAEFEAFKAGPLYRKRLRKGKTPEEIEASFFPGVKPGSEKATKIANEWLQNVNSGKKEKVLTMRRDSVEPQDKAWYPLETHSSITGAPGLVTPSVNVLENPQDFQQFINTWFKHGMAP